MAQSCWVFSTEPKKHNFDTSKESQLHAESKKKMTTPPFRRCCPVLNTHAHTHMYRIEKHSPNKTKEMKGGNMVGCCIRGGLTRNKKTSLCGNIWQELSMVRKGRSVRCSRRLRVIEMQRPPPCSRQAGKMGCQKCYFSRKKHCFRMMIWQRKLLSLITHPLRIKYPLPNIVTLLQPGFGTQIKSPPPHGASIISNNKPGVHDYR